MLRDLLPAAPQKRERAARPQLQAAVEQLWMAVAQRHLMGALRLLKARDSRHPAG